MSRLQPSKKQPTEMRPGRGAKKAKKAARLRNRAVETIRVPDDGSLLSFPDLIALVDKLASRACRRAQRCALDGVDGRDCWGRLEAAHIIPRTHTLIRFDPTNLLCLCHGHHRLYEKSPEWPSLVAQVCGPDRIPALESMERGLRAQYGDKPRGLVEAWQVRYEALEANRA